MALLLISVQVLAVIGFVGYASTKIANHFET